MEEKFNTIGKYNFWNEKTPEPAGYYRVDAYEIFISGSNSKMLSGELATLLSGR